MFLCQSPDKKKILTSQRTFDSEGENLFCFRHTFLSILLFLVSVLFALSASLSNEQYLPSTSVQKNCVSEEELYQNYQEKALHDDSDEDADSREPKPDNGIVVQYRPIRISWSQLSVVRHNSYIFFTISLYPVYGHTYSIHCAVAVESWNASALKNAVVSSLATVRTHPPTVSAFLCPSLCLSGSTGAYLLGLGWAGRQSQPDPQEVLEALLGLVPVGWQTLQPCQTANMLKMLPLQRSAVTLHYVI